MGNGHGWKASFAKAGVAGSNPAGGTAQTCRSTRGFTYLLGRVNHYPTILRRCRAGQTVSWPVVTGWHRLRTRLTFRPREANLTCGII